MVMLLIGILLIGSLRAVGCYERLRCTDYLNNTATRCVNANDPQSPYFLPESPPQGVQVLNIEVDANNSFLILEMDVFNKYKSLQQLEIHARTVVFNAKLNPDDAWNDTRREIFNVESLRTLIIDGADFISDRHSWQLPVGLRKLVMINCNYTEFNLNNSSNLQYVDFSHNPLIKLPTFPKCTPNLETLILRGNPLLALSVDDVARLCNENLKLELEYYSMGSHHRRCECQRLRRWFERFPNYKFTPFCNSEANCENDNLDEATKIRNTCLQECK